MAAIYSVDHALNYLVPAEDEVLLTAELGKMRFTIFASSHMALGDKI